MTVLTRPSLADIEAAFSSLGPREQFWLLDRLANLADLELDLDDLARQSAEAGYLNPRQIDAEYERLLWMQTPGPYYELRDKALKAAFKTDAERRAETLAKLTPAQRETRDTAILEAMQERRADKGEGM